MPRASPDNIAPCPPQGARGVEGDSSSAMKFSNLSTSPWQRFGDLLPLPLPSDYKCGGKVSELSSRRSRQRVVRRRILCRREAETIRSLNRLAGFEDEACWPLLPQNFAQKSVLARVHLAHQQREPPVPHESDKAALLQLLAAGKQTAFKLWKLGGGWSH